MKNRVVALFILLVIIPLIAGSLAVATLSPSSNVVSAAALTVTHTQSVYTAGATATQTIGFTTATSGDIKYVDIDFPTGFDVSGATLVSKSGIGDGAVSTTGQTVRYTVTTAASIPAATPIQIVLGGIVNPQTTGSSYYITVTTRDSTPAIIDGPSNSATFTIDPEAASSLQVSGITDPVVAGAASDVTVTALDPYSNIDTSYTGIIHFTSSDTLAVLPANYTFILGDAGVKTFTAGVTLNTVGEQSVTATDTVSSITGSQTGITVTAAVPSLQVSGITDPVVAGTASNVTVTALDPYGVIDTSYTGTIHFTSSDILAVLPANYTFIGTDNGVKTFIGGVTLNTVGEHWVRAEDVADVSIAGWQSAITVTAATPTPSPTPTATPTPTPTPTATPTATPTPTPTPTPTLTPTPTGTAGTAESWVRTEDGRITVHLPAGAFASVTNVSIEPSATCPEAPEDFTLGETCFSITAEAELLRSIDVCVRYTDADVAAADGDPQKLRLAVYDETEAEWDVLSTDIDERTQTACARVDHLSDFALLVGPGPPGFFSTDWWTVWWHVLPFAAGLAIVIAVGVWLWLRYRFYY